MYIKINNNNIEKYPYSINDLKQENPQISFPEIISDEILAEFNVYKVKESLKPSITYTQNLIEETPINNKGEWQQVWSIADKDLSEINDIQSQNRANAYRIESDAIFFKWQRGEATQQEWLDAVATIQTKYPYKEKL